MTKPISGLSPDEVSLGVTPLVVGAEQDPSKACPLKYATMARDYLRDVLGW